MNWVLGGIGTDLLAAVAAAAVGAIVLLHIVRTRRRRVEVPFSPLWQRVLEAQASVALWERWKQWIGLLLHLAIAAALLLALADPRPVGEDEIARRVVIVVDTSASMAVRDGPAGRSRLEVAREAALDVVQRLGGRDEAMIVRMDGLPGPVTAFTRQRDVLSLALRDLATTDTSARPDETLRFAWDALAGAPHPELVLVSDLAFRDPAAPAVPAPPPGVRVVVLPVGDDADNLAITAFNVRRYPANRTAFEVFTEVGSFARNPATVELSVWGNGVLIDTRTFDIAPGARVSRIDADVPAGGDTLEARIRVVGGDVLDRFDRDDVAWAVVPDRRALRVLLVSLGNLWLEAPLLLNENVALTRIEPAAWDPEASEARQADVVVFDGVAPPTRADGNYLYFAPSGEHSPWPVVGVTTNPIIHQSDSSSPLLAWIPGFRDLNIASAVRLRTSREDRVIASGIDGAPMIVERDDGTSRRIAVAFAPASSDLPLRVAFPVFLLNVLDRFSGDDARVVTSHRTGETWFIPLGRDASAATVALPGGTEEQAPVHDGNAVWFGRHAGVHLFRAGDRTRPVAASLGGGESDLRPVVGWSPGGATVASAFEGRGDRRGTPPWLVLVAIAIALLLLEWFTWNRRLTG